jgi:RHS repeat-associated protein
MSRRALFLPLLLTLLLVLPAAADVHPNTAPGFPADQSFHVGDVDSVNLFNGALTLTIPIGGSYPVNGGFSYNLKLTYNSSPWEFLTVHRVTNLQTDVDRTQAIPNRCSNAGLGWRISFGRMNPPCQVPDGNGSPSDRPIYQDENGTDHIFYPTLHDGDPEDAGSLDVEYTRDGSYLRLKAHADNSKEIDFPDGSVRQFDGTGMPTMLQDAFGNFLKIDYTTPNRWVLTDSQSLRTNTIYFRTDLPGYSQTVDYIELAVFGSSTPATYRFNYTTPTITRPCPHSDSDPNTSMSVSNNVVVPLLDSVTLPDTSSWSASGYLTTMRPNIGSMSPGVYPADACVENNGNITALTLPTRGRLEWTWQQVYFPSGSTTKKHLQNNPAVATRTMRYADTTVQGSWTYTYAPGFSDADSSKEHTTTVVDSLGHKTVNYFSIALDPSPTGWSQYEYSLPFSHDHTVSAPGAVLNLSRKTFQTINNVETLLRSEYVLYERDPIFGTVPPDFYNTNRRLLRSRTVYEDDVVNTNATYGGVINSNFDGLGHYRAQMTEGNFGSSDVRGHFADYNSAQGTYTVNPVTNTGSGYTPFLASSAWVLEAPTSMSDAEGGTAQVDLCYQAGTAAVTRKRVHRSGAAVSKKDLLTVYDLEPLPPPATTGYTGNVLREKFYGGDSLSQALSLGTDLCDRNLLLPSSPEVEIDHTYTAGVRSSSQYAGATFNVLDQTIDANTGLPSSSRDTAGLQTAYTYDAFGRLTFSQPSTGQGGSTEYVYTPATPASGSIKPNVIVRRHANGNLSAPVLAVNQIVFDSFGRVFQELKNLPDGSTAKRQTNYDAVGNKSQVSEWTAGQPGNFTQYLTYDPFGRPGVIQPPDGATHNVTMTYHGVRQVDRKVKIATAVGSETQSTTTEVYDRQGRLLSVTEPSGSGGANVTTTYGYDVGNRLSSVSTTATVGGSQVIQNRSFAYDVAGLLQSETHPEKGTSGNGSVTYPKYDSRGHVLQKVDGPHDLTFLYDSAERLAQVKETGASGRLLKAFTYAPSNGTNDWRQGKLQVATRYNYETIPAVGSIAVQVDETYTYGGRDGRISQRDSTVTPTVNGAVQPFHSFTQGFAYNDLGLVSSLSYPLCTHTGCTQSASAVFGDVPAGAPNQKEIEGIYYFGVTAGCQTTPRLYCPSQAVTRGQMAVFLLVAKEGTGYSPPPCTMIFNDVPCSNPQARFINEISRRGVTSGCGGGNYCPGNTVTNAEMAVFLITMLGLPTPACSTSPYLDVQCASFGGPWIAEEARRQITPGCGGGNFCPGSAVTRGAMAALLSRAFDVPVPTDPNTQRTANFLYTQGLLTAVTSGVATYGTLSYYPNLMVSQVLHGNSVTESQNNDPNEMRRPASLSASGIYASWSSGTYGYDGAGNIKTIGSATFTYDSVSRLVAASLYDGPAGTGNLKQQSYTFDAFGNLTNIVGTPGRTTPTSAQTNRLNGTGTFYDAAGNLTNWNSAVYNYDAFNQMTHMTSGSEDWIYSYTADDERIWSYNIPVNSSRWTLRDLGGKVLREYLDSTSASIDHWSVGTDYLYRDGLLLAAETQSGQRHYHLDHLGTPRLITRASGYPAAYHVYYPFGEEATAFNQDSERMKFTGHERDLASPAGAGDDLDYMHARHESPLISRFLSVDPNLSIDEVLATPQKWNRYTYVLDNPLTYKDMNGRDENYFGGGKVVNSSSKDVYIAFDADRLGQKKGTNLDVIIPLHSKESSSEYTFDADAVIIGPGQKISGHTEGSFKISAGSVEIVDGKNGELILRGDFLYFKAKDNSDPEKRSGPLPADKTPPQWKMNKSPAEMDKERGRTSSTLENRKERRRAEETRKYWDKFKSSIRFF